MKIERVLIAAAVITALAGCAAPMTKEEQLVTSGYEHILNQNWDQAETDLREALALDADNPFALLNLGVVYQQTGRDIEAREMYNRVIEMDSTSIAGRSNLTREVGRPLRQLAEDNLSQL
jgi:general secretion pathway protein D